MSEELDFGATQRGYSPGQMVFGRYELKSILGRGGMGIVWRALDRELHDDVALKFLPPEVAADPAAVDDLRRETRRSRALTHPRIVRIHDFVRDAQAAAISMEVVDGATLTSLRLEKEQRCFEVAEIETWVKQLCDGLAYAHDEAKVVHRDLKPANLMLTSAGALKIADFGISATISETTTRRSQAAGATSGTPVYMSPEQMMGKTPAATDDIYALGATIYEMLTGRPPFYRGKIEWQVLNEPPPSLADRRAELEVNGAPIPAAWESTVAACLAKGAAERPQSADDVWRRLCGEPAVAPAPASAPATPPPVRVAPTVAEAAKPAPSKGPWAVVILLLVVALGGAGWWFGLEQPKRQAAAAAAAQAAQAQAAQAAETARLAALRIEVAVNSEPSGARVLIDGREVGRTPWSNPGGMALGDYALELQLADYEPRKETLAVTERGTSSWSFPLERSIGGVDWNVQPASAEFWLQQDGPDWDRNAPADAEGVVSDGEVFLPTGTYRGWMRNPDLRDGNGVLTVPLHVQVDRRATSVVSGDLRGAQLTLSANVADLVSYVVEQHLEDGQNQVVAQGVGPRDLTLPAGHYDVTWTRDAYGFSITETVDLEPGEERSLMADLKGLSAVITSTPTGATVFDAGGQALGQTPLDLSDLDPQIGHTFRVQAEGYREAEREFTVDPNWNSATVLRWDAILAELPPYMLTADFRKGPKSIQFDMTVEMTSSSRTTPQSGQATSNGPTTQNFDQTAVNGDFAYGPKGNIVAFSSPLPEVMNGVEIYQPNTRVRLQRSGDKWGANFLSGGYMLENMSTDILKPGYPAAWLDDVSLPPGRPEVGRAWEVPVRHVSAFMPSLRLQNPVGFIRGRVIEADLTAKPAWAKVRYDYELSGIVTPMASVANMAMTTRSSSKGSMILRLNLRDQLVDEMRWESEQKIRTDATGSFKVTSEVESSTVVKMTAEVLEWGERRPESPLASNGATTDPELIVRVNPQYPSRALSRGIQGATTLRLQVGADGSVGDIEILQSAGDASLDNAARAAVAKWKFKPALQNGQPVASSSVQRVTFRLED